MSFSSEPEGAEVWLADAETPLGMTPFETELPRSADPLALEFRLEGHETWLE